MNTQRRFFYKIYGKNKHIPIVFLTSAGNVPEAKINFYCDTEGTDIDSIYRITKQQYDKENLTL